MNQEQRRKLNRVQIAVLVLVLLGVLVMVFGQSQENYYHLQKERVVNEGWTQHEGGAQIPVTFPAILQYNHMRTQLTHVVTERMIQAGGFGFITDSIIVDAYIDNELVYTNYPYPGDTAYREIGTMWNHIPLNYIAQEGDILRLEIVDLGGGSFTDWGSMYLGQQQQVFQRALIQDFQMYISSVILFCLGIFILIAKYFYHKNLGLNPNIHFIGFAAIFAGFFILSLSNIVAFDYMDGYDLFKGQTVSILLFSSAMLSYLIENDEITSKRNLYISLVILMTYIGIYMMSHWIYPRVVARYELWVLTGGALGLGLLIAKSLYNNWKSKNKKIYPIFWAYAFLVAMGLIDVIWKTFNRVQGKGMIFSHIGFLGFFALIGAYELKKSGIIYSEAEMLQHYRHLAVADQMTNLKNRIAYGEDIQRLKPVQNLYSVLVFDIDNLKIANDTYGHYMGDDMIVYAGEILAQIFGAVGDGYRMSGDEFVVILKEIEESKLEQLVEEFKRAVDSENKNKQYDFRVSVGYGIFDSKMDMDLEDTLRRGDQMMYEDKRRSKSKRH